MFLPVENEITNVNISMCPEDDMLQKHCIKDECKREKLASTSI